MVGDMRFQTVDWTLLLISILVVALPHSESKLLELTLSSMQLCRHVYDSNKSRSNPNGMETRGKGRDVGHLRLAATKVARV